MILPKLDEEGKNNLEPEKLLKYEIDNFKIDQFQSISLNGRTYPQKIQHGKMSPLYSSILNYFSVEDNTFSKGGTC